MKICGYGMMPHLQNNKQRKREEIDLHMKMIKSAPLFNFNFNFYMGYAFLTSWMQVVYLNLFIQLPHSA